MPTLKRIYDYTTTRLNGAIERQRLELTVETDSNGEFERYEDVAVNLFIDGNLIADIQPLLMQANIFTDIVDNVDWREISRKEEVEYAS